MSSQELITSIHIHRPLAADTPMPMYIKQAFEGFSKSELGKHALKRVRFTRVGDFGLTIMSPAEIERFHRIVGKPLTDTRAENLAKHLYDVLPDRVDEPVLADTFPYRVDDISDMKVQLVLALGAAAADKITVQNRIQAYYELESVRPEVLWPRDDQRDGMLLVDSEHPTAPKAGRLLADFISSIQTSYPPMLSFEPIHVDLVDYSPTLSSFSASDRGDTTVNG